MEAPDKIYLYISPFSGYPLNKWYAEKQADNDVGYTRTDAFIEKASEWLRENKDKYLYNTGGKGEYIPTCSGKMIDDFRKYMKGE